LWAERKLEIAVHDAVAVLNEGERGRLKVFGLLNLKTGQCMKDAC